MMTDEQLLASYGEMLQQDITVRRYSGTSTSRTKTEVVVRGRAMRNGTSELIGSVLQHNYDVVLYANDISDGGITLPLKASDKVLEVDGPELAIQAIIERKSPIGTLIAYELKARG